MIAVYLAMLETDVDRDEVYPMSRTILNFRG